MCVRCAMVWRVVLSRLLISLSGDIVWNVGTGYFGCRTREGEFCMDMFKDTAALPQLKMIELKLSQGAKPGHGGILPRSKLTDLIREARGLPDDFDEDVNSPPNHTGGRYNYNYHLPPTSA